MREGLESLYKSINALAEALGAEPPPMPHSDSTTRLSAISVGGGPSTSAEAEGAEAPGGLFDDEDTRAFYESFPDLRAMVPAALLGGPAASGATAADGRADETDQR